MSLVVGVLIGIPLSLYGHAAEGEALLGLCFLHRVAGAISGIVWGH